MITTQWFLSVGCNLTGVFAGMMMRVSVAKRSAVAVLYVKDNFSFKAADCYDAYLDTYA